MILQSILYEAVHYSREYHPPGTATPEPTMVVGDVQHTHSKIKHDDTNVEKKKKNVTKKMKDTPDHEPSL